MAQKGLSSLSEMALYGCIRCEACFTKPHDLKLHVTSCKLQKPYFCGLCLTRFAEVAHLEEHMRQHALSNSGSSNEGSDSHHGKTDTSVGNGLEDSGDASITDDWDLDEVIKDEESGIIKIENTETSVETYMSNDFTDALKERQADMSVSEIKRESSLNGNLFTCEICLQFFSTKESLQVHMICHYNDKKREVKEDRAGGDGQVENEGMKHRCNLCGKFLSKACHLRRHKQMVHLGPASCVCPICSRTFDNKRQLANHLRVHKGSPEKGKSLAEEELSEPNNRDLVATPDTEEVDLNIPQTSPEGSLEGEDENEIRNEEEKITFDCDDNASLKTYNKEPKRELRQRKTKNVVEYKQGNRTSSDNFVCGDCGRTFTRLNNLNNHRLTHGGFFRYKCAQCHKKFRLKRALVAHARSHKWNTRDKFGAARANVCDVCGRAFARSAHLRVHKSSVHTAPGSQVCTECNKTFDTRRQLANHARTHGRHLDDQRGPDDDVASQTLHVMMEELLKACGFQCHLCSSSFPSENDFESHFKSNHPEMFSLDRPDEGEEKDEEEQGEEVLEDSYEDNGARNDSERSGRKDSGYSFYKRFVENKRFVCSVCQTVFARLYHLKRHLTKHIDIRLHACSMCEKKFKTKETLKTHEESHTTEKAFPCTVCDKSFINANRLKIHSECHLTERNFQCDLCGLSFPSLNRLHQHQKSHRPGRFECPQCSRVFGRREHLKVHMQSHRDPSEKPVLCELCGVRVWSQYLLKKHMLVHTGQMPFTCDACGKQFKQSQSLKDHMYVHTGELKPHACTMCDKRCSLPSELRKHVKEKHGEKQHVCPTCGKKFSRSNQLSTHMHLTHTAVRNHACPQCEKVFKTAANLQLHMKRHDSVWNQACQFCNAMFADRFLLRQHEDEHRGKVRPHGCNQCERRFNDMATLKKHRQLVHHKGESHPCDKCEMAFTFLEDLQKHQLTHSLERPYECEFCNVRFARKYHVERHIKSHHTPEKEKPAENQLILDI